MKIEFGKDSCRLCLKNVGKIPLFSDQGEGKFAQIISSLFSIDVIYRLNFPNTACVICMENIKSAVKTKETILGTEATLTTYLKISKLIDLDPAENLQSNKDTKFPSLNVNHLDDSSRDSEAVPTKSTIKPETQPNLNFPGMYECEKCGANADTYKGLINHMRFHKDVMLCECEICGKTYKNQSKHRRHVQMHRESTPYKCNECDKRFKTQRYLAQHLLTHKTDPIMPCPKCTKLFCHRKALNNHLLSHNEKTEVCKICNKKFKHSTFLKTHLALKHNGKNYKKYNYLPPQAVACEYCGKQFTPNNLKKHVDVKHLNIIPIPKIKKTLCSYCDKSWPNSAALAIHMQSHFNTKKVSIDSKTKEQLLKYKCDECDKAFTSQVLLRKHKIIHSGVKNHICSYCEKRFAFKVYLLQHVRLLHEIGNPRNCVCDICGKVCINEHTKEAHTLSHTRETPFHCTFCDSKFVYAKSLRLHVKNKHKTISEVNKDSGNN